MTLRFSVMQMVFGFGAMVVLVACGSSSKSSAVTSTTALVDTTTTVSAATTTTPPSVSTRTDAGPTANFDSCSVVTQAEAASAIGGTVTKGVLGNATVEGGLACVFYGTAAPMPTTPNVAQPDTVRVVEVKGADAPRWFTDYESKVRAQPISGYGRLAFYDGSASLSILKGNCYLRIAVVPSGASPSLTDEEQLAKVILPKL
jgi:hypothetical protein